MSDPAPGTTADGGAGAADPFAQAIAEAMAGGTPTAPATPVTITPAAAAAVPAAAAPAPPTESTVPVPTESAEKTAENPVISAPVPAPPATPAWPPRTATGPWRWVHSSVRGSAHVENGLPCQDASATAVIDHAGTSVLVLVAADGAGSARCAERGSRLVSDELVAAVNRWLLSGGDPKNMDAACPALWLADIQTALRSAASAAGDQPRDWASTLIAAVLVEGRGLFFQVGDGAVIADGLTESPVAEATLATPATEPAPAPGPWDPVFWPDSGEYANTTYFVSDAAAGAHLRVAIRSGVTEVALFSDGLHAIALHHASKTAFAPFFKPLFARLRLEPGGASQKLVAPLAELLDSPGVRKRADDDRTLVLASRLL